jgi:hypothetical protein
MTETSLAFFASTAIYQRDITLSKDAVKFPWIADCPVKFCYFIVSSRTYRDAERDLIWHLERTCPMGTKTNEFIEGEVDEKGQPYTRLTIGKSITEKLWDELDEVMDTIKTQPLEAEMQRWYARGLTFALQLMLSLYYPDSQAIAREAAKRWRIKNNQQEFSPTPGYKYNPPPPGSNAYSKGIQQEDTPLVETNKGRTKTRNTRAKAKKELTDQEVMSIRTMFQNGFDAQSLANVYGTTQAEVERICSTP